jgi:hypothetical protein
MMANDVEFQLSCKGRFVYNECTVMFLNEDIRKSRLVQFLCDYAYHALSIWLGLACWLSDGYYKNSIHLQTN